MYVLWKIIIKNSPAFSDATIPIYSSFLPAARNLWSLTHIYLVKLYEWNHDKDKKGAAWRKINVFFLGTGMRDEKTPSSVRKRGKPVSLKNSLPCFSFPYNGSQKALWMPFWPILTLSVARWEITCGALKFGKSDHVWAAAYYQAAIHSHAKWCKACAVMSAKSGNSDELVHTSELSNDVYYTGKHKHITNITSQNIFFNPPLFFPHASKCLLLFIDRESSAPHFEVAHFV